MPISVFHALTATTPDNTNFEIRPIAHWNAGHVATANLSGSEIINAFSNTNGVSFGLSNGLVTVSAVGAQPIVSAGTTSNNLSQIIFSNSNGFSFGLNGSTLTGSYSNPNFSAGTTSSNLASVVFSNANGVSFGLSGSTITASIPGGGGSTLTLLGVGNTTGQSTSSTMPFNAFSIQGTGAISVGLSNGSFIVSAPATAALTQFSGGMSTAGNTAGTASLATAQLVIVGSNNISLSQSYNLGSATLTINGGGGLAVAASNTTFTSGTVVLSANGGAITISSGAQSALFSVPATSLLAGASGLTISTAGSTISVGNRPVSRSIWPEGDMTAISAPGQGSISIQYVPIGNPITATRLDALFAWAAASAATTATGAVVISAWGGVSTLNGSTLSSLSSGSTQTTYTYASNTAGNTQLISSAIRPISVPINMSFTQGEYFVGFNISTNSSSVGLSTTNLAQTISVMGANQMQTGVNYAEFTAQTATSTGLYGGMGIYTAQTAGIPVSIGLAAIAQTGASLSQANIALVFRNV
jgi:hypothetical protein